MTPSLGLKQVSVGSLFQVLSTIHKSCTVCVNQPSYYCEPYISFLSHVYNMIFCQYLQIIVTYLGFASHFLGHQTGTRLWCMRALCNFTNATLPTVVSDPEHSTLSYALADVRTD